MGASFIFENAYYSRQSAIFRLKKVSDNNNIKKK
jgi:hypothetical protein